MPERVRPPVYLLQPEPDSRYAGLDRLGPAWTDEPETDAVVDDVCQWRTSPPTLEHARRAAQILGDAGQALDLVVDVSALPTPVEGARLGYEVCEWQERSMLVPGQLAALGRKSDRVDSPLCRVVAEHFGSCLNEHGLFDHPGDAAAFVECAHSLEALNPDLFCDYEEFSPSIHELILVGRFGPQKAPASGPRVVDPDRAPEAASRAAADVRTLDEGLPRSIDGEALVGAGRRGAAAGRLLGYEVVCGPGRSVLEALPALAEAAPPSVRPLLRLLSERFGTLRTESGLLPTSRAGTELAACVRALAELATTAFEGSPCREVSVLAVFEASREEADDSTSSPDHAP